MSEETLRTREQQPEALLPGTWWLRSIRGTQINGELSKAGAMVADLTSYKGALDRWRPVTVIEAIQAACLVVERLYAYAHKPIKIHSIAAQESLELCSFSKLAEAFELLSTIRTWKLTSKKHLN